MRNVDIMRKAYEDLRGNWLIAIGAGLLYLLLTGGAQYVARQVFGIEVIDGDMDLEPVPSVYNTFPLLIALLLVAPFLLGFAHFYLSIARREEVRIEQIFQGYQNLWKSIATYVLMVVFLVLWFILLIIPGIIMSLAYSQAFFILADDQDIRPLDAIRKSTEMMRGYKWKYFRLQLRLVGLALLCLLTLGIGFIWLYPYAQAVGAVFYEDIKNNPAG